VLKKRIIGVVTVLDGWAVQSFGYRRHLPMGKVECVVENLDRWGADEILVLAIDRSRRGLGPDFETLRRLAGLNLATPLIYGGGIRSVEDGVTAVQAGADRLCIDALLRDDFQASLDLGEQLGAQALIAALPLSAGADGPLWHDYRRGTDTPLPSTLTEALRLGRFSEALLIDWRNEGSPESFDSSLVRSFPVQEDRLIAFGGLSSAGQIRPILDWPSVVAVGVGNFLSYREHAIQEIKDGLGLGSLRQAIYLDPLRSCPNTHSTS